MKKILTFLTDFGLKSSYPAQMKAVALSMTDADIIDITHNVSPQNIYEGAFLLKTVVDYLPIGTVNVGVVDPGVGTKRRGIVIVTPKQVFVGPDNGLLIPAAKTMGRFQVYEIKNIKKMMPDVSNTFHGRDIFTPVAANILNGIPFGEIGPEINDYVRVDLDYITIMDKSIQAKILHVDSFGNLITNITNNNIQNKINFNNSLIVTVGSKKHKIRFARSYGFVEKNELLSTIGSSGYLEISINHGDAAKKLNAKAGDKITINLE